MENLRSVISEYRQSKKKKKSFSKEEVWRRGMKEFKGGDLHSGKGGKVVTDERQARAIILSKIKNRKW